MESRAPTFADFTFNTIGKAPSLLGRLSSPGPSVTALPASPSPSPQPITRLLPSKKTMSKSRPSLLESLGASSSPNDLFLPSPGHDSVSQPRSNGSNLSQLQYPPTPPTDFPSRVVTTMVEQPPLSALSALKDRLSSITTSFQPADLTPTLNLARSSREQSILAQDSARRAVALSLDSIRAAQASSTAAQESFTAAEKADALSSDLLVSLDEFSTQFKSLDSLNSIRDISTELSVWVAREESSRAAQRSSRTPEIHQSPITSSGSVHGSLQPKLERDVQMTSSDAFRQSESSPSTSLFPTIPADIPIDDDLLDEKESLGQTLAEVRRERENIERLRRDTEDAELQRVKQRLLDAMRGADQFEEELKRARRSREAAARADYETQTRQCLEDARKAKAAKRESDKLKAVEEEAQRKAALHVAEEEARLKAEEETKHRLAEQHAQKERQAAEAAAAARLKLEQEKSEECRRLEAAAKVKLQRQIQAREVQEKAEKERQAEFDEKRREVEERRTQALLQNAQEAQKTMRVSQSPVRHITPSPVQSTSKPAKPKSNQAISGGVSLGHPPAARSETLPTEPVRSIPLRSRQHPTPAKLPPSLPPKPQQALSSKNNAGPASSPSVSLIHCLDESRGRSGSESDEYVPYSTQGNNGNVPLLPFPMLPSVQQSKLPQIGSPSKDQATKKVAVVSKTEPLEVSIPPPPLPHKKASQSSVKKPPPGNQNAAASASSQPSSHIVSSTSPKSLSSVAPVETSKSPLKKGPPGVTTLPQKSAAPQPQLTKKQAKAARRAEQLRVEQTGGTTSNQMNSVPQIAQSGVTNGKQNAPHQYPPVSQSSERIDQPQHASSSTQFAGGDGGWSQFNGQTQPQIALSTRPPTEPRSRRGRGDHYSPSPDRYAPASRDREPQPSSLREAYYPTVSISGQKRPRDIFDDMGRDDGWDAQRRRSNSPSLIQRLDTSDDFAPMDYGAPRRYVHDSPPREPDSPRGGGYRHMTPPPQDTRAFYPANSGGGSALLGRISTNGKQPRAMRGGGAKRGGAMRGGGPNYHMRGNTSASGTLAQRIRDGPPHGAR